MIALAILISVLSALLVLFLFFAVMRSVGNPAQNDAFMETLAQVNKSEIDPDRQVEEEDEGFDWTKFWYRLYVSTGRVSVDPATPGRFVLGAMILAGGIGFFIWPGDIVGGIIFLAGVPLILRGFFRMEANRRSKSLEKQLPQMLSGMRANLQANQTPQQAIIAVADDIPAPLGDELKILKSDIGVNVPLDVALRSLADRVPSREIKFLVASIEIAVSSGADLDPQLETIERIVDQRTRIRQKLASAVANAQPAILVSAIMIPAGFLFSFYSSEANREFWLSLMGLVIAGIIFVLYGAGLFITKKLIERIENT